LKLKLIQFYLSAFFAKLEVKAIKEQINLELLNDEPFESFAKFS
jgi:hypothetical protein